MGRIWLVILMLALALPVAAEDRRTLGIARLFDNDALGDQRDRWRTGSYGLSVIRGPVAGDRLPGRPGVLLEYRLRTEIVAPANLARPSPRDRRHAGILSLGVHTHFALGRTEARLGADAILIGPQTGLGRFQRAIHHALGVAEPDLSNQLGNAAHLMLSGEVGREVALSRAVTLRPFAEAQLGFETLVRAGVDLTIGGYGRDALMLRDVVTGQRYAGVRGRGAPGGVSLVLGGDVARVARSALLPEGGTAVLRRDRTRLRAGLHWQGRRAEAFYGVTWLSPEFVAQTQGQVVGSLQVRLRF